MKVLILDDERVRHDAYDKQYGGAEVWHAYDLTQFRHALGKVDRFDVVSLDHDLGTSETGVDAAYALAALHDMRRPDFVVVHSWNPVGAENIRRVLERADIPMRRWPFAMREETST